MKKKGLKAFQNIVTIFKINSTNSRFLFIGLLGYIYIYIYIFKKKPKTG